MAARLRRRGDPLYCSAVRFGAPDERGWPPALIFVTDPDRTPDPVAVARRLPRGAAVIFRGFGRPEAREVAAALAATARARGLWLLVGGDPTLAAAVGAHGVHLPERLLQLAPRLRAGRPRWRLTGAAHSARALRKARTAGVDVVLFSSVFTSASPSAAGVRPLGPLRLAALARGGGPAVYALGGVTAKTARRLQGVRGLAAVAALAE